MALSNLTKVQTVGIGSNIEVVGVITTGQFKSGTSNLHSTGVELTNLNVSGIATIGGNVTIGGTLTYQDVTNIDSVGLITAREGIFIPDSKKLYIGNTAGNGDLQLYHDGNNSFIHDTGTGGIYIPTSEFTVTNTGITQSGIKFFEGGSVELYEAGSKKIETTATGAVITGICTATSFSGDGSNLTGVTQVGGASSVTFNDSIAANFGTDRDLEIYHNGTHAVISNTTGNLHIKDNSIKLQDESANQMIVATGGQGVQLYHNASLKFSTTTHGIVVEDDNPYIVIKDNDTASGNGVVGWIEAQRSDGNAMWKIGNTHNDQNTLWINQTQNASTKFTGAVSGDTWEIYGNSGHFTPCTDNTFDIGESNRRIRNIYTADLHCSNKGSSNDVDGTWGDYTIQEGESDLFLINNRSGKKYKFNLTEVN